SSRRLFVHYGKLYSPKYLFESALQEACTKAGLVTPDGKATVTAHRFRHTVGTQSGFHATARSCASRVGRPAPCTLKSKHRPSGRCICSWTTLITARSSAPTQCNTRGLLSLDAQANHWRGTLKVGLQFLISPLSFHTNPFSYKNIL